MRMSKWIACMMEMFAVVMAREGVVARVRRVIIQRALELAS